MTSEGHAFKVSWTKRAARRLEEIGTHIHAQNPSAATRVVARIVSVAERLADHPHSGRIGRLNGTRELVLADLPYLLPYRASGGQVIILTIIHTAQRWPPGQR